MHGGRHRGSVRAMPTSHEDAALIRESLREVALERFEARILELAEPCLRFTTRRAAVAVGASKLGGDPDLPPDLVWPVIEGQSLTFLAQLDLVEVARLMPSPLPREGRLLFFFDRSDFFVGERACRVIHVEGDVARRRRPGGHEPLEECALELTLGTSLPHSFTPFLELLGPMTPAEQERLRDWDIRDRLGDPGRHHQILGYPGQIQEDVLVTRAVEAGFESSSPAELHREARRYRQLLGLDTDDAAGLHWVDMGACWFLIAHADLERHDFSRTSSVVQFC